MNALSTYMRLTLIIAALGIGVIDTAQAQKIMVESANPPFAEQETFALDIEIKGNGFDDSAAVEFFVSGSGMTNTGGVIVNNVRFVNRKTLVATIDVPVDADIAFYDIVVTSLSRGGKGGGIELFQVSEQGSGQFCFPWPDCKGHPQGEDISTCNATYFGYPEPGEPDYDPNDIGPCRSLSGGECVVVPHADPTPGMKLFGPCTISETLVVPAALPFFNGEGFSLTLVTGPSGFWEGGRAAIMNESRGVKVSDVTIIVDDANIADGSCAATTTGNGDLDDAPGVAYSKVAAAVALNPYRDTGTGTGPRPGASEITVRGNKENGAKFCNGLELGGATVDSLMSDDTGFRVSGFGQSIIEPDSFSQHGIVFQNIDYRDDPDLGGLADNQVYVSAGACAAIKVGPHVERGNLSNNTVYAPGGCFGSPGVGIDIESSGVAFDDGAGNVLEDEVPIEIVGNTVYTTGTATVAIRIDGTAVSKNESNTFVCDAGAVPADVTYQVSDPQSDIRFAANGKKVNVANGQVLTETNQDCPDTL